MPRKDDYEDAEEYLDNTYRTEDNEDREFNELSAKEQEEWLRDAFFPGTKNRAVAITAAHEMRLGLARPYGQGRGRNIISLRGHIHHILRGTDGRIRKWLD